MTRRLSTPVFNSSILHRLCVALSVLVLGAQLAQAQDTPPNIVFIFADDLGYGDLSSFGSTTIDTPNIDSLAVSGLKFTNFYSASPVCSPSRAALMTGRYPARLGIRHVFFPDSIDGMPPEEITIAEQLRAAGYSTGMVGKWHLGHMYRYMPWNQGFDQFHGVPFSNDMENFFFYHNREIDWTPIDQRYLTRRYTRHALEFIEQQRDRPFFLYLAHNMPHVPLYVSPAFEGRSDGGLYGDAVEELDWSVGQILARLEALGLAENTLVVFSSDNGPWLWMRDQGGSAGPLRDGKGTTFEGGQRVPTLARWPARIAPGREYHGMANMMDWFVTFSILAGVPPPADRAIDGRDIGPVLRGTGERAGDAFYYLSSRETRVAAYREGDWKLKLPRSGYPRVLDGLIDLGLYHHETLLFDLASDPGEQKNLADQYPERVERMRSSVEAFQQSLDAEPVRLLHMRATAADHRGYGKAFSRLIVMGVVFLAIVMAVLYGIYRLLKWRWPR